MKTRSFVLLLSFLLFASKIVDGQGVGVVLSGGGGAAMAHIGVLKALEENNIPIDYITGSSMGAMIGGLYASGYTPAEIEAMFTSEDFDKVSNGEIDDEFSYYEKQKNVDASYIKLKIKPNKPITNSLPTHIFNSHQLDFYLMTLFAGAEAASKYDFDSLMVPFRCIASDIYKKESKVFKKGNLGQAVRASMTYPFYLQAISIDSVLYFDGGLYDNFPKQLMIDTYNPDYIIGSNVSSNAKKPEEDYLFSQLENMLSKPTNYEISEEEGTLIDLSIEVGTFDWSETQNSINYGYNETIKKIPKIKAKLKSRMSEGEFDSRRRSFNQKKIPLHFESIEIKGLDKAQTNYIRASFKQIRDFEDLKNVKRLYYKLYSDNKIKFIFPTANINPETNKYILTLNVLRDKNLEIQIGGILSTSPINTGFASFKYNFFNQTSLSIGLNGYFGNVYQSAKLSLMLDVPYKLPFYWEPYFCINDYDFFKNKVSVFDEVQPPFIITQEMYLGNSIGFPFILNSVFSFDYKYFQENYTYYTNPDFSLKDTSDNTQFSAHTLGFTVDKFNYDYKQYASSGNRFYLNTRLVSGMENSKYTHPNSQKIENEARRTWMQLHLEYSAYPLVSRFYSLGFQLEAYLSNMPNFSNYFGTIIAAKPFQPLTESITIFQPHLRSTSWFAFGIKNVFKPLKNLQVRVEGYLYQPAWDFNPNSNGQANRGVLFESQYVILSAALVYHTKLGPISLNANYYQNNFPETSLLLNFGYTIFNKTARD